MTVMRKNISWATTVLLVAHFLITFISYKQLPSQIPTHFNLSGEVNAWGDKSGIWYLPVISLILFILLSALISSKLIYINYKGAPEEMGKWNQQAGDHTKNIFTGIRAFCVLVLLLITIVTIVSV